MQSCKHAEQQEHRRAAGTACFQENCSFQLIKAGLQHDAGQTGNGEERQQRSAECLLEWDRIGAAERPWGYR